MENLSDISNYYIRERYRRCLYGYRKNGNDGKYQPYSFSELENVIRYGKNHVPHYTLEFQDI